MTDLLFQLFKCFFLHLHKEEEGKNNELGIDDNCKNFDFFTDHIFACNSILGGGHLSYSKFFFFEGKEKVVSNAVNSKYVQIIQTLKN